MNRTKSIISMILVLCMLLSCNSGESDTDETALSPMITESALPIIKPDGTNAPEWIADALIYEVNIRSYTEDGTINAFSSHLERLRELGVTVLWLMPIYPNGWYGVSDYYSVNPDYGTKDDLRAFIDRAHEMGFHVILDWVGNHTAFDHKWINSNPEYYKRDSNGSISATASWSDVAQLDYDNPELRAEMLRAMRYWVEEFDIDGYRCDYAEGIPCDFWEAAIGELRGIKELYMLAEATGRENHDLLECGFDSIYNMELYNALVGIVEGDATAYSVRVALDGASDLPKGCFLMNVIETHDQNGFNGPAVLYLERERIYPYTALTFMMPGVPEIYTGGEILYMYDITTLPSSVMWRDSEYSEYIRALADLKKNYSALRSGDYGAEAEWLDCGNNNVAAFVRAQNGISVTVVCNLSSESQKINAVFSQDKYSVALHSVADELKDSPPPNGMLEAWECFIMVSETEVAE